MSKLYTSLSFFILLCLFPSCKKETDSPQSTDSFSLIADSAVRMQIHGRYVFDLPCDTSHYITVPVQVNKPGPWVLQTDSINGLKFSGTGKFSSTGLQIIKLYGTGSPLGPEKTSFKLKVGDQEISDTLLPIKSYLDLDLDGTHYLAVEYPSGAGELRSGSQYLKSDGILIPSCQYYTVPNPLDHFQLAIDYMGFPSYPGVEESTQWEAYLPAKHPIADIDNPGKGFRFTIKYVSPPNITTNKVFNNEGQFVQIISRGQSSTNVFVQGQIKTFPVYRIKTKFSANLGNEASSPSVITGEAIVTYWSMNAYQ